MTIILSIPNRFKIIFTGRFLGKSAVKWMSKIPPHLAYVATLPCETVVNKTSHNDLNIHKTDLHEICRTGKSSAVDERSEVIF